MRYVHDELVRNGFNIKLFGPEKSHIFSSNDALGFHMGYIEDMAADGTMDIMGGFCHHGYGHTPGNRAIIASYWNGRTDGYAPLSWPGIKTFNKPSWQTESSDLPISWAGAMALARSMQDEIVAGNLSAYIPWNYASASTGDTYALVVGMTTKTDKYYAMKHFSRYIRPGAVRIAASPDDGNALSVSAFHHENNGTLTIVFVNAGSAQSARITLPAEPAGIEQFSVFTSSHGSVWQESTAAVSGNTVTVNVPGSGFVTLYGQGTAPIGVKQQARQAVQAAAVRTVKQAGLSLRMAGDGLRVADEGRVFDLRGRTDAACGAF